MRKPDQEFYVGERSISSSTLLFHVEKLRPSRERSVSVFWRSLAHTARQTQGHTVREHGAASCGLGSKSHGGFLYFFRILYDYPGGQPLMAHGHILYISYI